MTWFTCLYTWEHSVLRWDSTIHRNSLSKISRAMQIHDTKYLVALKWFWQPYSSQTWLRKCFSILLFFSFRKKLACVAFVIMTDKFIAKAAHETLQLMASVTNVSVHQSLLKWQHHITDRNQEGGHSYPVCSQAKRVEDEISTRFYMCKYLSNRKICIEAGEITHGWDWLCPSDNCFGRCVWRSQWAICWNMDFLTLAILPELIISPKWMYLNLQHPLADFSNLAYLSNK